MKRMIAVLMFVVCGVAHAEMFNTDQPDKVEIEKEAIISIGNSALHALKVSHEVSFNKIWNNPDVTPQQIFDAFGNEAVKLFYISKATQDFIKALDPSYEYLVPPVAFELLDDGRVNVIVPVVEPEEPVVDEFIYQ